jgi:hypothetical protein
VEKKKTTMKICVDSLDLTREKKTRENNKTKRKQRKTQRARENP